MSKNISLDIGFDMGNCNVADDANNSYIKWKAGRCEADALAMKSVVETATGRTLNVDDHYLSIKVNKDCDFSFFKAALGASHPTNADIVEEIEGTDGYKWLMISLTKGLSEKRFKIFGTDIETINSFFEGVTGSAFAEMFLKSSHKISECTEIAKANNEHLDAEIENWPSYTTMCKDLSGHIRVDAEHVFCEKVLDFATNFVPIPKEQIAAIKKMNNMTLQLKLNSFEELTGQTKDDFKKESWLLLDCLRNLFFIVNHSKKHVLLRPNLEYFSY